MSTTDQHELALREHIRRLLSDYVPTHLTINYVAYTEGLVSELFTRHLKQIPEYDPRSLTLPVDPLDILPEKLKLNDVPPYDVKWSVERNVLEFIKECAAGEMKAKTKSQRVWDEECVRDQNADHTYPAHRLMSPILTLSSMRQTPKLRRKNDGPSFSERVFSGNVAKVIKLHKIGKVDMIPFPQDKKVKIEDALDLKLKLDEETHRSVLSLLKSYLKPPDRKSLNRHVKKFLQDDIDNDYNVKNIIESIDSIRPISPPIFERSRRMQHPLDQIDRGLENIKEMVKRVPSVDIGTDDMDTLRENMAIIDGWNAYIQPSSQSYLDTPSLVSSSSQIDELDDDMWLISSQQEGAPTSKALADIKMDDVIFSRADRMHGVTTSEKKSLAFDSMVGGESLSSFIQPLLPKSNFGAEDVDIPLQSSPAASPVSLSIVGQPPSELNSNQRDADSDSLDFDSTLRKIYKEVAEESRGDFGAIIMKEKMTGNDDMIMDVPVMPRPPKYEPHPSLPSHVKQLVMESPKKSSGLKPIKKVTGVKPLNIELSWRPFNFGAKVPTHDEVIDTANPPGGDEELYIAKLVGTDDGAILDKAPTLSAMNSIADDLTGAVRDDDPGTDFLLTRAERKRLRQRRDRGKRYSSPRSSCPPEDTNMDRFDSLHPSESSQKKQKAISSSLPAETATFAAGELEQLSSLRSLGFLAVVDEPFDAREDVIALTDHVPFSAIAPTPPERSQFDSAFIDVSNMLAEDLGSFHSDFPHEMLPRELPQYTYDYGSSVIRKPVEQDSNTEPLPPLLQDFSATSSEFSSDLLNSDIISGQTHRHSISAFLRMRGKNDLADKMAIGHPEAAADPQSECEELVPDPMPTVELQTTPLELLNDPMTLQLAEMWESPIASRSCMMSIDLMQKNLLVDCLESELCNIQLVERESLFGVDLIVSPNAAIIFFPLAVLPSRCSELCSQLASLSWSYLDILIVFEAFPSTDLYRYRNNASRPPYAYGPPVLKAIKKLRRDLSLYEGVDDKSAECSIRLSFANTLEEAAMFTRSFIDAVVDSDTASFNPTDQLMRDELQGEYDLASLPGMNIFAACIILSQCSVEDLLNLSDEDRNQSFGTIIGPRRVEYLNLALSQAVRPALQ